MLKGMANGNRGLGEGGLLFVPAGHRNREIKHGERLGEIGAGEELRGRGGGAPRESSRLKQRGEMHILIVSLIARRL